MITYLLHCSVLAHSLTNLLTYLLTVKVCAARVEAGGGRRFDAKEATRLRLINARESADLANAFVSPKFMTAMYDFNTKRKKTQIATFFMVAKATLPLWKPADVTPNPTN